MTSKFTISEPSDVQVTSFSERQRPQVHRFRVCRVVSVDVALPLTPDQAERLNLSGLHCGCGANLKPRCLNTDEGVFVDARGSRSQRGSVVLVNGCNYYLQQDATKPFPIGDECFHWVYTEHFIEHVSPSQGVAFFQEMRRLLKPGGFIRVSTPDLARYTAGYCEKESSFLHEHARRLDAMAVRDVPRRRAWLINQIFYYWGHRWIYDFEELRFAAESAGFRPDDVHRCRFRQGRESEVAAFDLPVRNDESLYVEMSKR